MDSNEIEKLARLARIAISGDEKDVLAKDMGAILGYVSSIQSVAGDGAPDTLGEGLCNVMREDGIPHETGLFTEALLSNAPRRKGNYVQVKKILGN